MKRQAAFGVLISCAYTSMAWAEPCVGPGFDRPLPGAINVQARLMDVPSARMPGLWQEGSILGHSYRLYANNEATLKPFEAEATWQISIDCTSGDCRQSTTGTPDDGVVRIATVLGACLLGKDVVPNDFLPPIEIAVEKPSPAKVIEDPKEPCGLAKVAQSDQPELLLQRLLVVAGSNPGPVDGIDGPRTRAALVAVIGAEGEDLDAQDAVQRLNQSLCEN